MGTLPFTSLYEWIELHLHMYFIWTCMDKYFIYIYIIIIILIIITELGQSNSDSSMIAGQTHLCQSFPRTPFFSGLGLSLP